MKAMIVLGLILALNSVYGADSATLNNPISPPENQSLLEQPSFSDFKVMVWAQQAITTTLNLNFVTYKTSLQSASHFFVNSTWQQIQEDPEMSNDLGAVKANKLVVSAWVYSPSVITDKGVVNGVYTWQMAMPIMVTHIRGNDFVQRNKVVHLSIIRIANPAGIAISQFKMVDPEDGVK